MSTFATGSAGIKIHGPALNSLFGMAVSNAGDVNGDGVVDILVTAPYASMGAQSNAGIAYVIYGDSSITEDINLFEFQSGAAGFKTHGSDGDNLGYTACSTGDVNNDGYDDIILSSSNANLNNAGNFFVLFGGASILSDIDVHADLVTGVNGFKITGFDTGGGGLSVGRAGDVNGDGVDDIIVGAANMEYADHTNAGAVYLIYGHSSNVVDIDLSTFTSSSDTGHRMYGTHSLDACGASVSGVGDVNGDDIAELIVACGGASTEHMNAGIIYVIFGQDHDTGSYDDINLSTMETGSMGVKILGAVSVLISGNDVSGAGDINSDGYPDIIIGAYSVTADGAPFAGVAYVVDGKLIADTSAAAQSSSDSSTKKQLSVGGIVGSVLGGSSGLFLLCAVLYWVMTRTSGK